VRLESSTGTPLFSNLYGKYYRKFFEGGSEGSDLSPLNRDDLRRALVNEINPSIEMREGYESYVCITDDSRTFGGSIVDQDGQVGPPLHGPPTRALTRCRVLDVAMQRDSRARVDGSLQRHRSPGRPWGPTQNCDPAPSTDWQGCRWQKKCDLPRCPPQV
jgi:hypothetical protein